jgi:hypothetical protein
MLTMILLRVMVQGVALLFGSAGIFFLWESFRWPALAGYTIVFLTAATLINLFLPKPKS